MYTLKSISKVCNFMDLGYNGCNGDILIFRSVDFSKLFLNVNPNRYSICKYEILN